MKIERTRNAARNIVFDGMLKMFNLAMPLIMRRIILYYLGVKYLGLSGLFNSILSFLNLAELGVGSAMIFSMYKPIAEDDTVTICALMRLYRIFYRVIGLFIAVVGLAITPFLTKLVHSDVPEGINLYVLYYMNLGSTVLTYWLFAYKNCLLHAHQRTDVGSKIALVINIVLNITRVFVLVFFQSYYLYLGVQLVAQIIENITKAIVVTRMYPNYSATGSLSKEKVKDITHRVRDLFTAKFSGVILNSADTLVISAFLGLIPLALFQNYFYIVNALRGILYVFLAACKAGIGNSLVTENDEKNFYDLRKLSLMFNWVVSLSSAMLLCMYQPFMSIWMGEEYLLNLGCMFCFVLYFYVYEINRLVTLYKDAAGMWHKDRFRPLVASLTNLALNLATVQWLGLYGVVLSTVVSIVFVELPWLIHNLFHEVFPKRFMWPYMKDLAKYIGATALAFLASWYLCSLFRFGNWPTLILNAGVSFIVTNVIFFLLFFRTKLFKDSLRIVKKTILRRKKAATT